MVPAQAHAELQRDVAANVASAFGTATSASAVVSTCLHTASTLAGYRR
jgi:hypothetical protein